MWKLRIEDDQSNRTHGDVVMQDARGNLVHAQSRLVTLIGVEVIYQYLVTGILVILAVSVDQLTHRRRA